jgi:hypothetical protein
MWRERHDWLDEIVVKFGVEEFEKIDEASRKEETGRGRRGEWGGWVLADWRGE